MWAFQCDKTTLIASNICIKTTHTKRDANFFLRLAHTHTYTNLEENQSKAMFTGYIWSRIWSFDTFDTFDTFSLYSGLWKWWRIFSYVTHIVPIPLYYIPAKMTGNLLTIANLQQIMRAIVFQIIHRNSRIFCFKMLAWTESILKQFSNVSKLM